MHGFVVTDKHKERKSMSYDNYSNIIQRITDGDIFLYAVLDV